MLQIHCWDIYLFSWIMMTWLPFTLCNHILINVLLFVSVQTSILFPSNRLLVAGVSIFHKRFDVSSFPIFFVLPCNVPSYYALSSSIVTCLFSPINASSDWQFVSMVAVESLLMRRWTLKLDSSKLSVYFLLILIHFCVLLFKRDIFLNGKRLITPWRT